MPGGPTYGPVGWQEILAWAREGRIASDCELAESRSGPWRDAAALLPNLVVNLPAPADAAAPSSYPWATGANGAPVVTAKYVAATAPAAMGGAIADGTYALTAIGY